jgi:exosortase/archaeosortase family protein
MKTDLDKVIRLAVLCLVLGVFIIGYPNYFPIPQVTALLIAKILGCFIGASPIVSQNSVLLSINNEVVSMDVSPECSALIAMLLFIFVMFITPGIKVQHRLYSLLFIPILYAVNLLRIISEVFVGSRFNIETMSIYHAGVGQIVFFSTMILLYIGFLKIFGYLNNNCNSDSIAKIHEKNTIE